MNPVTIIIDGVAHIADGGDITERRTPTVIAWHVLVDALTWCDVPTEGGHIPRAAELLAGPLNICHVCRAVAATKVF